MTDRAAALRSLRSSRAEGLPPPPPIPPTQAAPEPEWTPPAPRLEIAAAAENQDHTGTDTSRPAVAQPQTRLDDLLADPVRACRDMGNLRENMPARPLNVDLTPDLAAAFDEQCRTLRVKKKDVVELLLRGWLQHQGRDLD